ncbi:protein FAM193A-like, partial [Homarus americanus]
MDMKNEANDASRREVEVGGGVSSEALDKQLETVSIGNQECEQPKLTLTESFIGDFSIPLDTSTMDTRESSYGSHENGEVMVNGVEVSGSPTITTTTMCHSLTSHSPQPQSHQQTSDEEANFEVSELINEILHQSSYLDEASLNGLEFVESLPDGLDSGDVDIAITSTSEVLPLYLDHTEGRSSSPDSDSNMRTASEGSSTPTSQLSAPSTHSSDHQNYSSLENREVISQQNITLLEPESENKLCDTLSQLKESKPEDAEVVGVSTCVESLSTLILREDAISECISNSNISETGHLDNAALQSRNVSSDFNTIDTLGSDESKSRENDFEIKTKEDENDTESVDDLLSVEQVDVITTTQTEKLMMVDNAGEMSTCETAVSVSAADVNGVGCPLTGDSKEAAVDNKALQCVGDICETTTALESLSLNTENFENFNVETPVNVDSVNGVSEVKEEDDMTNFSDKPSSSCHDQLKDASASEEASCVEEEQALPEKDTESSAHTNNDCLCKRMQAVEEGGNVMVGVWAELRSSLRQLHRSMIPQSIQGSAHRSRPSLNRIKALANMLVTHDAHQLYMRISHLAHELCIELKVRLLATINDNPSPEEATTFIQGVCDSYQWVMSVCEALHPALERLDSEHLSRFKLNWVTVNMHIFHSTILTDPDIQDYAQICKQKLSGSTGGDDVMGCLASLHRTLAVAEAVWVRADVLLQDYAVERAAVSTRRRQLLADWEQFKAQQRSQHHQEHAVKTGVQNSTVTSAAEDGVAQCPCDDCAGGRGKMSDSQSSSVNSRIPLSSTSDIRPPSSCECHFCNASMSAATPEEPVLPPSSGNSLPPLAQPQLSLYPHIHSTPPGSDIVGVGQSREELGPIPPAPTTKPPITTNPYVGSDLLTEQLMREWEMVYGDTLTPPGSHPIHPPSEAVIPHYDDPSSLVSGVETLRISSSRPSYTRTMVDPSLPYVPDSHATARANTTILPSSQPPSSTASHPVSSSTCHASKVPQSSRNNTLCTEGGCSSTPQVSSGGGTNCCSVTNTTSVITHTRAHHTHTTASAQKGKCVNGLEESKNQQLELVERSPSRESVEESETSGGDEWSSGDESDSSTTGGGRQKYSDRRDRLLQILSRKKKARSCSAISCSAGTTSSNTPTPAAVPTPVTSGVPTTKGGSTPLGGQNIDKILDFIEGNHTDEAKHAKKAAKKARQRQKKHQLSGAITADLVSSSDEESSSSWMAIRREEEEGDEEEEDFEEKEGDCEEDEEIEEDGPLAELRRRAPDVTITVVRPGQQTSRTSASPQMASQRPREPSPTSMEKCKPPPAKLVPSLIQNSAEPPPQSHSSARTILHPYRQSNQQGHQSSRQASAPTPPLVANPASFNSKETVANPTPLSGPSSLSNILKGMDTTTKEKDKGSQMVTIRRVMDPNNSEPTVTITLKGDQPEKDKVLFKLVNGQAVSGNGGHSGQSVKKGGNRLQSQPQVQSHPHPQSQSQPSPSEPTVPEGLDPEEVKKFKKRQKKERQRLRKQQEQMQEQQKGQLQQLELQKQQEILRQQQEHIHQQQLALQRQQEELLRQQQQQQNNQSSNSKKNKKKSKVVNTANPSNNKNSGNKVSNHNSGVSAVVYDGDDMAQSFNLPPGVTINKVEGQPGMVTISNSMGGAFSQPFLPNPNVYPSPLVQGFSATQETSIAKPYGRTHAPGLSWNSAVDGTGNYPDKDNVIVVDTNNSYLGASPATNSSSSKREISSDERVMMAVNGLIDPSTLNMTQKKKFKKKKKELQEEKEREEQKQREEDELMDQMYNLATGKWTKQCDVAQGQTQNTKNQNKKNQKQKENCKQPAVQNTCSKQNSQQLAKNGKLQQKTQEIQQQKQKQHQDVTKQNSKSSKQNGKDTTLQNITNQPTKNFSSSSQNGKARYAQYLEANANTLANIKYNTYNGSVIGEHVHEQCMGGDDDKKSSNKKKKTKKGKKNHLEDMTTIDSVFTPKDVAEGELDETERDVEAFKRFCFNSVPRYTGEKPKVNINVKDIMIKKRPCNVNL